VGSSRTNSGGGVAAVVVAGGEAAFNVLLLLLLPILVQVSDVAAVLAPVRVAAVSDQYLRPVR